MSKSNYLSKEVLDHVLGGADYSRPATVYLALFTSNPDEDASGTEATGSAYARVAITNNGTNFPAATGTTAASKTNGATFTFTTATGDWSSGSDMTHWALFDASSGGNCLYYGALGTAKPVLDGDTASVAASSMVITED